jgi:hypothetical protein
MKPHFQHVFSKQRAINTMRKKNAFYAVNKKMNRLSTVFKMKTWQQEIIHITISTVKESWKIATRCQLVWTLEI